MAYVSVAGVRALLQALDNRRLSNSSWLVGLDDALTQPAAIRLLMGLQSSRLRVGTLASSVLRFHPKVLYFETSQDSKRALLMVGSANLTSAALGGNAEAVVFLQTESLADSRFCSRVWRELWSQGHSPTEDEIKRYERLYRKASRWRRRLTKRLGGHGLEQSPGGSRVVLADDEADLDPSQATTCWIECGYITAMGRELEFKAEQGLFFGLAPAGAPPQLFRFRTSEGSVVTLRMKYQQNHMWRLQMNNDVPEVRRGLRPRLPDGSLGRSHDVAVFTRASNPDLLDLRFVKLNSKAFRQLKKKSSRFGTIGHTAARSYGWC